MANGRKKTRVVLMALAAGGLVVAATAVFLFQRGLIGQRGGGALPEKILTQLEETVSGNTLVRLYRENVLALVLVWKNVPLSATHIVIYRSPAHGNRWERWKVVTLTAGGSGAVRIQLTETDANNYDYYFEAISRPPNSGDGLEAAAGETALWTSPRIQSGPLAQYLPPVTVRIGSFASEVKPPSPVSGPAVTAVPSVAPAPPPTSGQSPSLPLFDPNRIYYYRPDGTLSGSTPLPSDNFWVAVINGAAEIGWRNLPQNTDTVIVYRARQNSGPWTTLFRQENIVPGASRSIRLADNTLTETHYYRFEALSGGTVVVAYGPLILEPGR